MGMEMVDLTAEQWEALKALRNPQRAARSVNSWVLDRLVRLGLIEVAAGEPAITAAGRAVLVRGSSRLLDVAA